MAREFQAIMFDDSWTILLCAFNLMTLMRIIPTVDVLLFNIQKSIRISICVFLFINSLIMLTEITSNLLLAKPIHKLDLTLQRYLKENSDEFFIDAVAMPGFFATMIFFMILSVIGWFAFQIAIINEEQRLTTIKYGAIEQNTDKEFS